MIIKYSEQHQITYLFLRTHSYLMDCVCPLGSKGLISDLVEPKNWGNLEKSLIYGDFCF